MRSAALYGTSRGKVQLPSGEMVYFRYYDPRVLQVYLPTCRRDEIKIIYGPVLRYIAEDARGAATALVFPHDPVKIKTKPVNLLELAGAR